MKQKLLERLQLMDKAIQDQHQKLQQANGNLQQAHADLNMLNGCRQELVHIINLCDMDHAPNEEVKAEEKPAEQETSPCVLGEAV